MLRETTTTAIEKALGGLALRERAIADNIANAETPGYYPRRVTFEDALRAAIQHEAKASAATPAGRVVEDVRPRARRRPTTGPWGVTVQIENEMADLARTSLWHEALARTLAKRFRMLRTAITGGGQ